MKRVHLKKSNPPTVVNPCVITIDPPVEDTKKVDVFIQDLKQTLDEVHEKTDEVIDEVITPIAEFVVEDVIPIVEEVVELFNSEPPEEQHIIISKRTIKINDPIPKLEEVPKIEEEFDNEQLSEINTIPMDDKILAHEECLLKISPIAKLPISHVLAANLIFSNPCDDVVHEIVIEDDDPCSFLLYVKNNRNEDVNAKITYHVLFQKDQ
jgi:translation elongation factor EF-G